MTTTYGDRVTEVEPEPPDVNEASPHKLAGPPEVIGGQLGHPGGQGQGRAVGSGGRSFRRHLPGVWRRPAGRGRRGRAAPPPHQEEDLSHAAGQCRMLTARAITRSEVHRAETLWMLIRSFARVDSGIVSVGLNAVEFVTDT